MKGLRVVVPVPFFDKIATISILRLGDPKVSVAQYWKTNREPSDEQKREWRQGNILPIDVGREKYHAIGRESALERLLEVLAIPKNRAIQELADMVAKNNATGYLKSAPYSIVWILREAYKLGYDTDEVVEAVLHVMSTWFAAYELRDNAVRFNDPRCRDLFNELRPADDVAAAGQRTRPFTVAEYMRNMRVLGVGESEIVERAMYFIEINGEARVRKEKAEWEWLEAKKFNRGLRFWTEIGLRCGGWAVSIDTDCQYLGRAGFAADIGLRLLEIRDSVGHETILTRGLSLVEAAPKIMHGEMTDGDERWHYETRGEESLLNGTFTLPEIPPTTKDRSEIRRVLGLFAEQKKHERRPAVLHGAARS